MKSTLLILASLITLASCTKRIETTAGLMSSVTRNVSNFDKIAVYGNINLFLVTDTTYQVKVEAGERLLDYVQTVVVNNKLELKILDNPIVNTRPVNIYVSNTSIKDIRLEGSGTITSNSSTIVVPIFSIALIGSGTISLPIATTFVATAIEGNGTISLTGNSVKSVCALKGSGKFNSKNLITQNSNITIEGSGRASVYVTDSLTATIIGSGIVTYSGNPTSLEPVVTGSGAVISQN